MTGELLNHICQSTLLALKAGLHTLEFLRNRPPPATEPMESVTYLLILLVCLVGSAFFSGSETALLRVRRQELDEDAKTARSPSVLAARELLQSMQRLLVTVLLGNNIVNVLGAAVASALAVRYLGETWGIVAATVVMTFVTLILGEVMPKAFAAAHPKPVAYAVRHTRNLLACASEYQALASLCTLQMGSFHLGKVKSLNNAGYMIRVLLVQDRHRHVGQTGHRARRGKHLGNAL